MVILGGHFEANAPPWGARDFQMFLVVGGGFAGAMGVLAVFHFAAEPVGRLINRSPALQLMSGLLAKAALFIINALMLWFLFFLYRLVSR